MGIYRYFLEVERKKQDDNTEHEIEDEKNDYDLGIDDEDNNTVNDEPIEDTPEETEQDENEDTNYDLEIDDNNAPDENDTGDDAEETQEDDNSVENNDEDKETNYDLGDDTSETDMSSNTDTTDDNISDDAEEEQDPDKGIKELEKTMGSLSEEQIKIQNTTLKKQYIELYNNCTNILERLNDINKKNDTEEEINFGISSLQELKKLIYSYLVNTYDTRSYVQNTVNYTEYLVTLNSVNKLLKEINIKNDKK